MANDEASALKEEARYFDFTSFYKSTEFSDRTIRLELLDSDEKDPKVQEAHELTDSAPASDLLQNSSDSGPPSDDDIPVNSIVLAAKSSVLRTMLSNGMKESDKKAPVIVRVTLEEKAAFEEMVRFFYSGTLSPTLCKPATDVRALVALLFVADKFDVPSLMGAVCEQLRKADGAEVLCRVPSAIRLRPLIKEVMDDAVARVVEEFKDVSGMFSCMSGEYLETLLSREDLQHKDTQSLVTAALRFQAYSDSKKEKLGQGLCQRNGVRFVHLEIVDHFLLDESGKTRESRRAVWFGKNWFISVQKNDRKNPPSVGVFLYCEKSSTEESSSAATDTLALKIYVRTWPSGLWKRVIEDRKTFSLDETLGTTSWGGTDALQMPWDEARGSEKFVGSVGTVTIKAVARRFQSCLSPVTC
ncbi:hypothetical protein KFL_000010680 [Klebsormidium nitens]|uniref:BTB domain-containing protein n=1 Tax=Klebsormidium nitens TaxID=105231 RepID=A0A0U9HQE2_KLENI|nr:hypothetical protein KFL_000010680 [Klebsormidium nitens]|eukprot:GAQ77619.1 hypothetical protein KFL_000010680 [Klebsormidium nitens]